MTHMRKRILSFLLAICMAVSLLPTALAAGEDEITTDNLSITASGGESTIHVEAKEDTPPSPGGSASGDTLSLSGQSVTIDRDYNQTVTVYVYNWSEQAVQYYLECENPYDDIYMNFVSSGSEDAPLTIPAGESQSVILSVFAQNAKRTSYTVQVTAQVEDGEAVTMDLTFNCRATGGEVTFQKGTVDPATLATAYTVRNAGAEAITDLTLFVAGEAEDYVRISPSVENYTLEAGEYVEVKLIPDLGKMKENRIAAITGQLIAQGGVEAETDISFDTMGQEITSASISELAYQQFLEEENTHENVNVNLDSVDATIGGQSIRDLTESGTFPADGQDKVEAIYDLLFDETGMFGMSMDSPLTYIDTASGEQKVLPITLDVNTSIVTGTRTSNEPFETTYDYNEDTNEYTYTTTIYMTGAEYNAMIAAFRQEAEIELLGAPISAGEMDAAMRIFDLSDFVEVDERDEIAVEYTQSFFLDIPSFAMDEDTKDIYKEFGSYYPGFQAISDFSTVKDYLDTGEDVVKTAAYVFSPNHSTEQKVAYTSLNAAKVTMRFWGGPAITTALATSLDGPGLILGIMANTLINYTLDKLIDSLEGDSWGGGLFFDIYGRQCTNAGRVNSGFYLPDFGIDYGRTKIYETGRMYDGSPYGGHAGYAEDQFGGDRYIHDRDVEYNYYLNGQSSGTSHNNGLTQVSIVELPGSLLRPGKNTLVRRYNTNAGHYSVVADTEITVLYPADAEISFIGTPDGLEDVRLLPDFAVYEENILPEAAIIGEPTTVTAYVYNRGSRGGVVTVYADGSDVGTYYVDAFSWREVKFNWTPNAWESDITVTLENTFEADERKTDNNTATRTIYARSRQVPMIDGITPTQVILEEGSSVRFIATISNTADVSSASFTVDNVPYTDVTLAALTSSTAQAAVSVSGLTAGTHTVKATVTYQTGTNEAAVERLETVTVQTPDGPAFQVDATVTEPAFTVMQKSGSHFYRVTASAASTETGYTLASNAAMTANPENYYLFTTCAGGLVVTPLTELSGATLSLDGVNQVTIETEPEVTLRSVQVSSANGGGLSYSLEVSPDENGVLKCAGVTSCELSIQYKMADLTRSITATIPDTANAVVRLADYYKLYRVNLPADRGYSASSDFSGTIYYMTQTGSTRSISVSSYSSSNRMTYDASNHQLMILPSTSYTTALSEASSVELWLGVRSSMFSDFYAVDLTDDTEAVDAAWNHQEVTYACTGASELNVSYTVLKSGNKSISLWGMPLYLPVGSYEFGVSYAADGQSRYYTDTLNIEDAAMTVELPGPVLVEHTANVTFTWPSLWNSFASLNYYVEDETGALWNMNITVENGETVSLPVGEQTLSLALSRLDGNLYIATGTFSMDVTLEEGTSTDIAIGSTFTGSVSIDSSTYRPGYSCKATLSEIKDENGIALAYYTSQTGGQLNGTVTLTNKNDPFKQYTVTLSNVYYLNPSDTIAFNLPEDMETGDYTYEVFLTTAKPTSSKYTVTFDPNGGSGAMADQTVESGKAYTLPACGFGAPTGKEFDAWEIDGVRYALGAEMIVESNITVKAIWKAMMQVASPVISPDGGQFIGYLEVSITCGTDGASIYYTTDGTTPGQRSNLYRGAFTIDRSTTIKVIAVKAGMTNSEMVSASFYYISNSGSNNNNGGNGSNSDNSSRDDTTTTTYNSDGSITTTVTDPVTNTVTETTVYTDGAVTVVETAGNGTVTIRETAANGVEVTTVRVPGAPVTASVAIPSNIDSATVTIAAAVTPGTVAVDARTGEIIMLSVPTADGLKVRLDHSANIVLEDRSKAFSDADGHWAENAIAFVSAHRLFNGTGENTFNPQLPMTRAMLMTVLARLADVETESGSVWYERGMEWAMANGISDGSDPDGQITREQLATMLWRYAGTPDSSYVLDQSDAGDISSYAQTAMAWAMEVGIIKGYEDGNLHPTANATRAEVATMLMRFLSYLTEK